MIKSIFLIPVVCFQRRVVLFAVLSTVMSCSAQFGNDDKNQISESLEQVSKMLDVPDLSYIIVKDGKITTKKIAFQDRIVSTELYEDIITNFLMPARLEALFASSIINESKLLGDYYAGYRNQPFTVGDLVCTSAGQRGLTHLSTIKKAYLAKNIIHKVQAVNNHRINKDRNKGEYENKKVSDLFNDLLSLERRFRHEHPELYIDSEEIENLTPGWYTRNMVSFYGYRVLKLSGQTFLWNSFSDREFEITIVKSIEANVFAVIIVPSGSMRSAFALNRTDLLQSPVGLVFIKEVLSRDNALFRDIDFGQPVEVIRQELDGIQPNEQQVIINKELFMHAMAALGKGLNRRSDSLFALLHKRTGDSLYSYYMSKPAIAEIAYAPNEVNASIPFKLSADTWVRIFAGGQVIKRRDYLNNAYNYDNIQLFLNRQGNQVKRIREETKTFQFNVGTKRKTVLGKLRQSHNSIFNDTVEYAFNFLTATSYIVEVKIPWAETGLLSPRTNQCVAINILAGDSDLDEDLRKTVCSWWVKPSEGWDDVSKFGILRLATKNTSYKAGYINSLYAKRPILVDGFADKLWSQLRTEPISLVYQGSAPTSPFDYAVSFKSMWDKENLYFLFCVTDNCVNALGWVTKDKCWISKDHTDIVWKLAAKQSDIPTMSTEEKLFLKAGSYELNYNSDKSHSSEGWYSKPPVNDVYGAVLYREDQHNKK